MPIPENQLEIWAKQGAIQSSSATYESIKNCINGGSWNADVNYQIYLQGSYKNTTNIYGNSDVDIVVEFTSIFSSDTSRLDLLGKSIHDGLAPAKYTLAKFKAAIIERLKLCYGESSVIIGNRAILVEGNGSRLDADVIVCNTYKKYNNNNGSSILSAVNGITFCEENTGKIVVNYPAPHYENGVSKNDYARTNSNLKKVTRIFKNMRASLVDHQAMSSNTAPSYFVECLIYNVWDIHFRKTQYTDIVPSIINHFIKDEISNECDKYVCQNEQVWLFGSSDQQWNRIDAKEYINKLIYIWNNYPL